MTPACLLVLAALPSLQAEAAAAPRASEAARVPMMLAKARPIPVVEAFVNGQGPYRFLFDTGASVNVFDSAFVEELGLPSLGTTEVGDPSESARIEADRVEVETIRIGSVELSGPETIAFDRREFHGGEDLKGVLGLPMFANHLLTVDYPAMELRIEEGELGPADGEQTLDYTVPTYLPLIETRIGEERIGAYIDSGSPLDFSVSETVAARLSFQSEPVVVGRGRTVNSEFEVRVAPLDGSLWIGGHEIAGPSIHLNPIFPQAVLGYGVLREFAITFDQASKRVRFVRPPKPEAPAANAGGPSVRVVPAGAGPRLGVQGTPVAEGLKILQVLPDSLAEKMGLQSDDVLLAVNGRSMTDIMKSGESLSAVIQSAEGLTLKIRRAGQEQELHVKLQK